VGDELTVTFEDEENRPITWRIVGQYPEISNAGQMMMVSLPAVARVLKQAEPTTYLLKLAPDCDVTGLKQVLKPRRDSDLGITFIDDMTPDEVIYLRVAILALSIILIGIALVNVFNTSLLAMQEKVRVVGILKTVGMTPAQVAGMTNTAAGMLGLVAVTLGIPLGVLFTRGLLNALASAYGFTTVDVTLHALTVVGLIPLMVLVSMMGSLLPGRWAARMPIVRVLRSE
jgi:putative ABC transport system permease protein